MLEAIQNSFIFFVISWPNLSFLERRTENHQEEGEFDEEEGEYDMEP